MSTVKKIRPLFREKTFEIIVSVLLALVVILPFVKLLELTFPDALHSVKRFHFFVQQWVARLCLLLLLLSPAFCVWLATELKSPRGRRNRDKYFSVLSALIAGLPLPIVIFWAA